MAAPGAGRRATQVTLDLEIEGSTIAAETSTTFEEEDRDYDAISQKFQPKNDKFAQLLALRHQKRKDARLRHALDEVEEAQSSPRSRLSSLSMTSSFAGLPQTQQQLTKVMASIEQAQEEAKLERAREALEREAAQGDSGATAQGPSSAPTNGGLSGDELSASCAMIQAVAQALISSKRASNTSASALSTRDSTARIEIQGLEHIGHHHQERVLTFTDLAMRHRITSHKTDSCGVENYMNMVVGRDTPLIPRSKLMVADDPPQYELPDATGTTGKGKKKLIARGTKNSGSEEGGSPAQQRLSIPELLRAYEDHCLVADKALEQLRLSNTGASMDPRIISRLRLREHSLICEPIPGIRTLFYFPLLDGGTTSKKAPKMLLEDRRVAQLESCARRSSAKGLQPSPLAWEFLGSQAVGCLAYGCHRSFHSVFEYEVALRPRRFYLNLERMCRGLTQPLTLRKILYLCFGRSLDELTLWHRLFVQYRDAKRLSQVRQWVDRFALSFGDVSEAAEVCRSVSELDDVYTELPMTEADPLEKKKSNEDEDRGKQERRTNSTSKRKPSNSASPHATVVERFSHPFGIVDYVMEMVVSDAKRKKSVNSGDTESGPVPSGLFSHWFHSSEAPVALLLLRFQRLLLNNTSRDELVETYLTLLPLDVGVARRAFLHNVDAGILPPSSVWLPPNVTLEALEAIENNQSAKSVADRDARVLMQCLGTFRTTYHTVLSSWIGDLPSMDDPALSQSVSKRSATRGGGGVNSHIPTPTATSVSKRLLMFRSLPPSLFAVVKEEMHPDWPPVDGWDKPDFGGLAPRPGEKPAAKKKKKTKSDDYGYAAKPSTVIQGDIPTLESVGTPFVPSPEDRTADDDLDDDEDDEFDVPGRRPSTAEIAEATQPHSRYSDFDVLLLYHGQGLYFEAFVALLTASPMFLRDMMGLMLRFAVHFQSVE
jgi:hypothetical protein